MPKHDKHRRERSRIRKLRKQDKRAAVILLTLRQGTVNPSGFGRDDDGRYSYEWRCSYEYDEWDWQPASDFLSDRELDDWFYGCCLDEQGETLPDESCPPRPPSAMRKLPSGYRWRGRRIVPVDKHGGMVSSSNAAQRAAAQKGG